ncbi:hypothetical protein CGLO_14018 [Colletotrichum gloeosporioides Cg-14]|uniref:Uncharacterized protein n=1 Tax=Colletotrichum gloeosporioides (strain Cg-14) TaxID=1237896 RepID=T0K4N1_COLGC|nr:hypothetical protein CGLO_14018 [Colletotrichum gloeosporioides Cg-14]
MPARKLSKAALNDLRYKLNSITLYYYS